MQKMKTLFFVSFIAGLIFLIPSCRKNDKGGNDNSTLEDRYKDTAALYSRDIYLWYNQIPATFKPRSYTDLNALMVALRTYSDEPGFTQPVDRWSFAVKQADWDNVTGGIAEDFGLNIFFLSPNDLRVRIVERSSPAGLAGIRRGWKITKINNNTNITTANANFIVAAVYQSTSVNITFEKPDGSSVDIPLTAATYQEHPVLLDSVYNIAGKKAGYMVYNSFLGDSTETVNEFARVFNRFTSFGVEDVIVDLRYNGGGFAFYQSVLANYLINNAAGNGVMMNQVYNDKYTQYNSTVRYAKKGTLNLPRVFFIVSENSASASELLINNLKPYMEVVLVGPDRTYGKPVGYFAIPIGDSYIFPVSSRTTNKNGEGNYFDGFALNHTAFDGLDKDFGDVTESCLASTLKYITTGAFRGLAQEDVRQRDQQVIDANRKISAPDFKGTIERRKF